MSTKRLGTILIGVVLIAVLGACAPPPAGPGPDPVEADLSVAQLTDDHAPYYWAEVHLTTVVYNHGPATATDVTVTVSLPPNVTYVTSTGGYDDVTGTWTVGSLAPESGLTLTITARAGDVALGEGTVTATVSSTTDDPNAANDAASVTEHSVRAPILVAIVPDPGNPALADISSAGTIGWTASVTPAIPGAPAPYQVVSWFCDTGSLIPCPLVDGLILPDQQALTFALADLQIDTYHITLRTTPGDPNYQQEFVQTDLSFITVNSGGS